MTDIPTLANTTLANTTLANTTLANTTLANTTLANTTLANTKARGALGPRGGGSRCRRRGLSRDRAVQRLSGFRRLPY